MRNCWLRNSAPRRSPFCNRRLRSSALAACAALAFTAAAASRGNRTTPPTLDSVEPLGAARGTTVEITVEGLNLARASAIYFSEPGITGRILRVKELPDLPDIRLGSNGTPSTIDLGPLPGVRPNAGDLSVALDLAR